MKCLIVCKSNIIFKRKYNTSKDFKIYYLNVSDVPTICGYNYKRANKSYVKIGDSTTDYITGRIYNNFSEVKHIQNGIDKEKEDLIKLGKILKMPIEINYVMNYKIFDLPSGNKIKLGGRIDAYFGKKYIIETKHRKDKLFAKIPLYEQVQCECYMRILDRTCIHSQTYDDEISITYLKNNNILWDKILKRLDLFYKKYDN